MIWKKDKIIDIKKMKCLSYVICNIYMVQEQAVAYAMLIANMEKKIKK